MTCERHKKPDPCSTCATLEEARLMFDFDGHGGIEASDKPHDAATCPTCNSVERGG